MAGHELVHDQRPIPSLDLALQDAGVDVGYVRSDPPLPHDMGMADEESAMGERDFDEMSDGERRMFEVLDEAEPIVWKDEVRASVLCGCVCILINGTISASSHRLLTCDTMGRFDDLPVAHGPSLSREGVPRGTKEILVGLRIHVENIRCFV